MNLDNIEKELAQGQVSPPRLAEMRDWMAAYSSSLMDRQDQLVDLYADWFHLNRPNYKSDKACDNAWDRTEAGKEQRRLETLQKRLKLLIAAVASHVRIASDQARNLF